MSLQKVMDILWEHRDKLPNGAWVDINKELMGVYKQTVQEPCSASRISFTNAWGHRETIKRDAFIELDSHIYHVHAAMRYDAEFYEWCECVKRWRDEVELQTPVPEKYHQKCIEYYIRVQQKNAGQTPLGLFGNVTLDDLRKRGVSIDMDDETFYKISFLQLGSYFIELMKDEMISAAYFWDEFVKTPGRDTILWFIQEGARTNVWKHMWYTQRCPELSNTN